MISRAPKVQQWIEGACYLFDNADPGEFVPVVAGSPGSTTAPRSRDRTNYPSTLSLEAAAVRTSSAGGLVEDNIVRKTYFYLGYLSVTCLWRAFTCLVRRLPPHAAWPPSRRLRPGACGRPNSPELSGWFLRVPVRREFCSVGPSSMRRPSKNRAVWSPTRRPGPGRGATMITVSRSGQ